MAVNNQQAVDALQKLAEPPQSALEAILDQVLLEIGGFFWYRCLLDSDDFRFSTHEQGRAGWVLFVPEIIDKRIHVRIFGSRIAIKPSLADDFQSCEPHLWTGVGQVDSTDGKLVFKWESQGDVGRTEEAIQVDLPANRWFGKFKHITSSREEVSGKVEYLQIKSGNERPTTEGKAWFDVNIEPRFRESLPVEAIGALASLIIEKRRVATELPPKTLLLIDVVSKEYIPVDISRPLESRKILEEKFGEIVPYLIHADITGIAKLGQNLVS